MADNSSSRVDHQSAVVEFARTVTFNVAKHNYQSQRFRQLADVVSPLIWMNCDPAGSDYFDQLIAGAKKLELLPNRHPMSRRRELRARPKHN